MRGGSRQQLALDACTLVVGVDEDGEDAAALLAVAADRNEAANSSIGHRDDVVPRLRVDLGVEAFRIERPSLAEGGVPQLERHVSVCSGFIPTYLDTHGLNYNRGGC